MKLSEFVYILSMVIVIGLLVYTFTTRSNDIRSINESIENEAKKREDIVRKMELLKYESVNLDSSIVQLKKYVDKKEQSLSASIQTIKNKGNVQVRNVSDSSFVALLKELQPN